MRHFQFQYHDRDDDGEDSVAERLKPTCFHRVLFQQRNSRLAEFLLSCGATKPLVETRRAKARFVAGSRDEALIVQLGAEVAGVNIRDHLPWVSRCAQETPDEFVHSDWLGTGNLDYTV